MLKYYSHHHTRTLAIISESGIVLYDRDAHIEYPAQPEYFNFAEYSEISAETYNLLKNAIRMY